jgi:O-antigen ligase
MIEGEAPVVTAYNFRVRLKRRLRVSVFVTLCAILLFGPLALGVVDNWSIALFETGAAFLLLLWMIWQLAAPEINVAWSPLFAPMLAFFGLALMQIGVHRTAYLHDSLAELWLYIGYGILTFVTVQLVKSDESLMYWIGNLAAAFGAIYAVFGVLQSFTSDGKIYWSMQSPAVSAYGSYVNHNHYAGLMELLFPFALVLAFSGTVQGAQRGLLIAAAIMMAASVFLCQSRGGMFAVIVETLFLAIFGLPRLSRRKSAAVFLLFCVITAAFLAWIAPDQVGSRIIDTNDPARWSIHRDSVRMFAAHPFLGSGLGTFATAFLRYRTFFDGFVVNHAHDDYLEVLLECGLAGLALVVWFLAVLYREGLRQLRRARVSRTAIISVAALTGCTGLLAHSFMDFNLHIPANAAVFYVLCAIATASPRSASRSSSDREPAI